MPYDMSLLFGFRDDENGKGWTTDESYEESGYFYWNGAGELCWHNDSADGGEDSVFLPAV